MTQPPPQDPQQPPQDPQQPPWPPTPPGGPFGHQQSQHGPPPQQWPPNQQPWPAQPGPTSSNSAFKWALLGVALLAIIAVTAVAIIFITRDDGPATAGGNPNSPNNSQDIASANDTGPVAIITGDPTCEQWTRLAHSVSGQLSEWGQRDSSVAASQWDPQTRTAFESAASVFRAQADQMVPLARETPHRVMRELYEQTIAYYRAYVDAIPTYTPRDNYLVVTANTLAAVLNDICASVTYLSAAKRAPAAPIAGPPTELVSLDDPANPRKFLTEGNRVCTNWVNLFENEFEVDTKPWVSAADSEIPASQWTPQMRANWDSARPILTSYAEKLEDLGRTSQNPILEDFAVLASQYFHAFAAAIPTYVQADSYLYTTAKQIFGAVAAACDAVEA